MDIKNLPFGRPPAWTDLSDKQQLMILEEQIERLAWKYRVIKKDVFRFNHEVNL